MAGHPGLSAHATHELCASTWNDEVEVFRHTQHLAHERAVGRLDELHRVFRDPGARNRVPRDLRKDAVGAYRLFPTAQDHGVARLEAEGRNVDGNVRAALIDDADYSERDAALLHLKAIGKRGRVEGFLRRIGEFRDPSHVVGHAFELVPVEREPTEELLAQSVTTTCIYVLSI